MTAACDAREIMDFELSRRAAPAEGQRRAPDRAALRLRGAQEIHGRAGRLEPRAVEAVCRARPDRRCPSPRSMAASAAAPVETMIVMEAFGRALALEPYLRDRRARRRLPAARRRATREARDAAAEDRGRRDAARLRACRAAVALRPRRRRDDGEEGRRRLRARRREEPRPAWRLRRQADRLGARLGRPARPKNGIGLFLVDAKAAGRVAPRLSDHGRAARRRGHARRRQGRRRRGDRRAGQCLSADRAGGRRRRSRRLPPKRSAR